MAYDYTPANIRTINIHPVHGTTAIFDINNYSTEIEPDLPPHSFDQTLIYSILDNTSSKSTIRTLESKPLDTTVNVHVKIDNGANCSITSTKVILHLYKDITSFHIGSIDKVRTMTCAGGGI